MNINVNDIIDFDNYSYRVLDIVHNNDNTYAYVINNEEFVNDTAIVKIHKTNNTIELKHIDDDNEFEYVLKKIYLNHKRDILSYFD